MSSQPPIPLSTPEKWGLNDVQQGKMEVNKTSFQELDKKEARETPVPPGPLKKNPIFFLILKKTVDIFSQSLFHKGIP